MSFQFIQQYHNSLTEPIIRCKFTKLDKLILISVISKTDLMVFGTKTKVQQHSLLNLGQIVDWEISEESAYIITEQGLKIIDFKTKNCLFNIKGVNRVYVLNKELYLSIQQNYLYKVTCQSKELIGSFAIVSSCLSKSKQTLAIVTTDKTITINLKNNALTQNSYIFSKIMFCDDQNLIGISTDKSKIVIKNIVAGINIFQTHNQPVIDIQTYKQHIYILSNTFLRILDLNTQFQRTIHITSLVLFINVEAVYIITPNLRLLGLNIVDLKKIPTTTASQGSVLIEDMEKMSFQVQIESFENQNILNSIIQEHQKIYSNLNHRKKCIQGIHKWWYQNNDNAALNALINNQDLCVINDCFKFIIVSHEKITLEKISVLMRLALKLIDSKYVTHVETSLKFMNMVLDKYDMNKLSKIKEIEMFKHNKRFIKILSTTSRKQIFEIAYVVNLKLEKMR